jgi:hypothetical protein
VISPKLEFGHFALLIVAQEHFEPLANTSFCTGCGGMTLTSTGAHRRWPNKLHESLTGIPPTSGKQGPCRDVGVGEIAPGFAMPSRAERASHIDPPASSDAIMRKACPYRGENPGPGKDAYRELDPKPELENPKPELENNQGQGQPLSVTV